MNSVSENFKKSRHYPASNPLAAECHRLLVEAPVLFDLNHRSHLLKVAAAILTEEFKTVQQQRAGYVTADGHMIQVFEKLSSDELLGLSVGDLAERFGCSRRHLNRLFNSHFGVSVAALRMELRLLKAVSLLRDRETKIINVAEQCGFNHLGLFNTCFKRRFGMSPGRWRERAEGQDSGPTPAEPAKSSRGAKAVSGATPFKKAKPPTHGATSPNAGCPLIESGLCPWANPGDKKKPNSLGSPAVFMGMASAVNKPHKPTPFP